MLGDQSANLLDKQEKITDILAIDFPTDCRQICKFPISGLMASNVQRSSVDCNINLDGLHTISVAHLSLSPT